MVILGWLFFLGKNRGEGTSSTPPQAAWETPPTPVPFSLIRAFAYGETPSSACLTRGKPMPLAAVAHRGNTRLRRQLDCGSMLLQAAANKAVSKGENMAHETENKAKREDRPDGRPEVTATYDTLAAQFANDERIHSAILQAKQQASVEDEILAAVASAIQEPLESMQDYWARRDSELQAEQNYIAGLLTFGEYIVVLLEVL